MKKQVSPTVIAAVFVVVAVALGAIYFRQFVYTPPTPRPNRGISISGSNTSSPPNPGN